MTNKTDKVTPPANRYIEGGYKYNSQGFPINSADLVQRQLLNLDPFDQSRVVEYTPLIELKSIYGVSALRDVVRLTGAVFRDQPNNDETATEYDISATAITGGEQIFIGLSAGSQTKAAALTSTQLPKLDIPVNSIVTVCARTISGSATVNTVLRDRQEW